MRQWVHGGRATPAGVRGKALAGAEAQRRVGATAAARHALASLLLNGARCHGHCVKRVLRRCRHRRRRHRSRRRRRRRCCRRCCRRPACATAGGRPQQRTGART